MIQGIPLLKGKIMAKFFKKLIDVEKTGRERRKIRGL